MMAGIDHAAIDLDDVDPTSDWLYWRKLLIFSLRTWKSLSLKQHKTYQVAQDIEEKLIH